MHQVVPYALWIGNLAAVRDLRNLFAHEIEVIIDLAGNEQPACVGREMVYCRFPLVDGPGNSSWLLRAAIETTARFLEINKTTLVFCGHGMSRSPALAAAALSLVSGRSPEQCLVEVVQHRGADLPHDVTPGLWHDVCASLTDLEISNGQVQG